jgi:hypothetical protein
MLVSEMLGRSTITLKLETYSRRFPAMLGDAAAIDAILAAERSSTRSELRLSRCRQPMLGG